MMCAPGVGRGAAIATSKTGDEAGHDRAPAASSTLRRQVRSQSSDRFDLPLRMTTVAFSIRPAAPAFPSVALAD